MYGATWRFSDTNPWDLGQAAEEVPPMRFSTEFIGDCRIIIILEVYVQFVHLMFIPSEIFHNSSLKSSVRKWWIRISSAQID